MLGKGPVRTENAPCWTKMWAVGTKNRERIPSTKARFPYSRGGFWYGRRVNPYRDRWFGYLVCEFGREGRRPCSAEIEYVGQPGGLPSASAVMVAMPSRTPKLRHPWHPRLLEGPGRARLFRVVGRRTTAANDWAAKRGSRRIAKVQSAVFGRARLGGHPASQADQAGGRPQPAFRRLLPDPTRREGRYHGADTSVRGTGSLRAGLHGPVYGSSE